MYRRTKGVHVYVLRPTVSPPHGAHAELCRASLLGRPPRPGPRNELPFTGKLTLAWGSSDFSDSTVGPSSHLALRANVGFKK